MTDHPQNERCDELATTAADGEVLIVDEGVEGPEPGDMLSNPFRFPAQMKVCRINQMPHQSDGKYSRFFSGNIV